MQTLAAVAEAKDKPFRMTTAELEAPRDDEVLVRIVASGICHTDLSAKAEILGLPLPMVLGHEGSGVVEAVGSQVRHLQQGDHVVLSGASCGICTRCHAGMPSYCDEFVERNLTGRRADGTTPMRTDAGVLASQFCGQSSFATHTVVNARSAVRVDRDLPLELLGPTGCALITGVGTVINALKPRPGTRIAIFGVGAVGLSAVLGGVLSGCEMIIAVDPQTDRLRTAEALGATHTLSPSAGTVGEIIELSRGGVDYSVECSGNPGAIVQAIEVLGRPGWSAQVGAPALGTTVDLDISAVGYGRGIRGVVLGESNPQTFIPFLTALFQRGRLPFDRFVQFYDFDQIDQAFDDAERGNAIKPILRMPA